MMNMKYANQNQHYVSRAVSITQQPDFRRAVCNNSFNNY